MGNEDRTTELSLNFLTQPGAQEIFAKLDYALKDGVHIQNRGSQSELFRFIQESNNEESLGLFYKNYFGVILESGGEGAEKYYYLNFLPQSRGGINQEHRYFLASEYVIVGFLIYKIIFIDGHIDLVSVKQLQKIIRHEYEDLKHEIYRTLAKARREKTSKMDDDSLDEIVSKALVEFNKIGWVLLQDDHFDTLPAFQRLNRVYGDYINNLDQWLKE